MGEEKPSDFALSGAGYCIHALYSTSLTQLHFILLYIHLDRGYLCIGSVNSASHTYLDTVYSSGECIQLLQYIFHLETTVDLFRKFIHSLYLFSLIEHYITV